FIHSMMFIHNDGNVFGFCKFKCHKNFKASIIGKVKWAKALRRRAGKELAMGSSFECEIRNGPAK
ncbi:hypothetical protein A6R68_13249, partial [Neotoma lepida]